METKSSLFLPHGLRDISEIQYHVRKCGMGYTMSCGTTMLERVGTVCGLHLRRRKIESRQMDSKIALFHAVAEQPMSIGRKRTWPIA